MAKLVSQITLGIDVSKDELVICDWDTAQLISLPNQRSDIKDWLKSLYGPVRIAIEPTSTYHLAMAEEAQALDFEVYLINPRQLAHYREAINERNKTDPADAWLLARYLAHEASQLRRYQPQSRKAQQLWTLLKRRAMVVESRKQPQQSLAELQLSSTALFTQFEQLIKRIDERMKMLIRKLGWWADYQLCLSVPGIGPVNAAALVSVFHRGAFAGADAVVAFIGFDVRLRESGKYKGNANSPSAVKLRCVVYSIVPRNRRDAITALNSFTKNNSTKVYPKSPPKLHSLVNSPESSLHC